MANEAEFEEAKKFIGRLLGILDLGADQLVLIPGNHDLAWTNSKVYEDGAEVTEAPATAKSAYRAFYKKLLEHEAHDDLSMARRYVFPSGQVVEFCAVNSSSLEQGKNFLAGMGRVQERAFVAAAGELGWRKAEATRALRVLATHHHLTATEDLEDPDEYRKGFGMAIDAARIQRLAAEHKVHLIMHGHKHRTFLGFQGVYQLPEETRDRAFLGSISLLGGGSAGSPYQAGRAPAQPANYFNVLRVGATQLSASLYRGKARGVFEHFKTWGAPLSMDNEGNLQLGPWAPHSGS
jgi:3',5'-cyclic AMP phosphodiesterase CpdA